MDGNRRWAKNQKLLPHRGHNEGYETFKNFLNWCKDKSIRNIIVYAWSSENWNRSQNEVQKMMELLRDILSEDKGKLREEKVQVTALGDIGRFPKDIQDGIKSLENDTKDFKEYQLGLCLSYGGRAEIVDAVNRAISKGEKINESEFSKLLWTGELPDPDLIIRTSDERRLSNFLPWQSVYSELFFVDALWPDFSLEDFEKVLDEYQSRERRKGK